MKRRELLEIPLPDVPFPRIDIEAYRKKHGSYFNPRYVTARIVPGEFGDVDSDTVTTANGTVITNPALRYRSDEPSGILCVWIHSVMGTLRYSIFACADSCEWRVYSHNDEKWRTAMLQNLTGYCAFHEREYIYTDAQSAVLGHYFGSSDPDTLRALDDFQVNNRTYRTKIALLKSRRNIDALMASVPPLPGGIDRYIDNHVLRECRYLWYKKDDKHLVGLCTHCGKTCRTDKYPKGRLIGRRWKCPECGSEVEFRSINASANVRNHGTFSVIQNVPGGLMVTEYSVSRWNDRPEDVYNPSGKKLYRDSYSAIARAHIKYGGHTEYYEWTVRHNYLHDSSYQWYVFQSDRGYYTVAPSIRTRIFPGNVRRVLASTPWKYSGLAELAKSDKYINVPRYLDYENRMPPLEKLVKCGLYSLASAVVDHGYDSRTERIIGVNYRSTLSLDKLMGVNRAELRMFREVDIREDELAVYKQYKANGRCLTARDIRELRTLDCHLTNLCDDGHRHVYITEYVTSHKLVKYINAQLELEERRDSYTANRIINDWNDYLIECLRLRYDLSVSSVVMPKNLRTAHARTSSLVEHKKNSSNNRLIKARCKALGKLYATERDGYIIRMAKSADELIFEGKAQHICVGGYGDRYAEGACTILLLRKSDAPNDPFVTIELREHPDYVEDVQIRAYRNGTPDDATMKWWDRYKKDVLSKLGGKPYAIEHGNKEKISACAG